jgi:iron complex outermembrane recepter protein
MRIRNLLGASMLALACATPAWAQDAAAPQADTGTEEEEGVFGADIVVTAQRQSQRLQDVPIAVSAFSAESLDAQQIENTSDLQLTLPNVVFSKGNFTGASFTIRGIGDLCVGVSCDSATAIHLNDQPLYGTRIFETEFFDLEQVEVLRGPQGTLYGRNATSGVVNFRTARPDLSGFGVSGEFEYGNFNSIKVKGMVNLPIGETLGVRVAGVYLNRDGYTNNLFDGSDLDGRDLYGIRGTIRWEPSDSTTLDLLGYYFRENDNRLRIQKQRCQRDATGVLGCLNNRRDAGVTNANSTFVGVLTSREFLTINGIPSAFGLGSLYGADSLAGALSPQDVRTVNTDSPSTYFAEEIIGQAHLQHEFDGGISVSLSGTYQKVEVDSSQDYNLSVQNRSVFAAGLGTLAAAAAGQVPGLPASFFTPIASAIIPNGPNGDLCTSLPEETGTGAYGGFRSCSATPTDFDRSNQTQEAYTGELIISSDWDGAFNFLIGGIYSDFSLSENSYYVNSFGIDYLAGLLGTFNALGRAGLAAIPGASPPPPGYFGTPFFRNTTDQLDVTSYGIFGETYFQLGDRLKVTLGLRYNNDEKYIRARSTLASFLTPFTQGNIFDSPFVNGFAVTGAPLTSRLAPFDADPATACSIVTTTTSGRLTPANLSGCELFQERDVSFSEFTGRAVVDWQITPDNLLYFSYSRGYKSGGINPPLQPIFAVDEQFSPEFVDAFEIGSKNQFGALTLNVTGFYYKYDSLQLSRIVARTSVNDNVDAEIYGLELEAIITPTRDLAINIGASYLHTEVSTDKFLANPRDPGGGRSDAVIIKDITNGSNCAVVPTTAGNAAGANGFVGAVNAGLGLRAPTGFGADSGIASTGAFGICSVLQASTANPALAPFGGMTVLNEGVAVNIRGNRLPQAPNVKFSTGIQYTIRTGNDMTIVPRFDLTYTGDSSGNIFNGRINEIEGYAQANAQIQLNGADDRWFARAFIQNIFDTNATTGLYVTDQSSGLFSNIFTLDPRRYGLAVGVKF